MRLSGRGYRFWTKTSANGPSNVVVCSNDPADLAIWKDYSIWFWLICALFGWRTFQARCRGCQSWSGWHLHLCATRQRRILADIWPSLKTGGYLIYSTCTFNPAENEENLKWLAESNEVDSIRFLFRKSWELKKLNRRIVWFLSFSSV